MKIHRILNNNVVIILDEQGKEKIVCGKGIAFQKASGSEINERSVNKVFVLESEVDTHFKEIVSDIPIEYLEVTNQIITYAEKTLQKKLPGNLFISLSDHIYSSIKNFLEGIELSNVLLLDIKQFYEKEYEIGVHALEIIEDELGVTLPEDEAGCIALHIINVMVNEGSIEHIQKIMEITQEISNIVKYYFLLDQDLNSVYYHRFITHLKFFAQRLMKNKHAKSDSDSELFEIIKMKYKMPYKCVEKISDYLKKQYNYRLIDDEKMFLTIHIERIVNKSNKQQ